MSYSLHRSAERDLTGAFRFYKTEAGRGVAGRFLKEFERAVKILEEGDGQMLDRITFDPKIMGGRACLRGMRMTVSLVVNLVANGMTVAEILREYPSLEAEDIRQSLQYAASLAAEEIHPLAAAI